MKRILQAIYNWWTEEWRKRNDIAHGSTQEDKLIIEREYAIETIRVLYEFQDYVQERDKSIFRNITEHTEEDTRSLRQWVRVNMDTIIASAQTAGRLSRKETNRIVGRIMPWKK